MMRLLRRAPALLAFLLLPAPALFCQAPKPQTSSRTPVLLITIDTLRADHLQCYGYKDVQTPAIDALAARGTLFEHAYSEVPLTLPSHTAILSGTYPMWNGVRTFDTAGVPPNVGLLSQAFERHGYRTAAFVSSFVLDRSWGLDRGFETYDDRFATKQYETRNPGDIERRGDKTVDHVIAWLQSVHAAAPGSPPFFIWLHLYDPHSPYDPPQPFHSEYAGHLYDGEIAFTSAQLGRLFAFMRKRGLYRRSLIVLTADHGESLGQHGEAEHGFFIYTATLHVPLIFKLPEDALAPQKVNAPVELVDIAPTILDLLHIRDPLTQQFQGVSLASRILKRASSPRRPAYAETYYPFDSFGWSPLRSILTRRYQFISAPHPELYNLIKDPGELDNLYNKDRALADALRSRLVDVEREYTPREAMTAGAGPALSEATLAKLKSLGYLAYSAPAPLSSPESLPDPKSEIHVYNTILHAQDLSALGRYHQADAILKGIQQKDPSLYLVPFMQAENASRMRNWPEAERQFVACLKLNPHFENAMMGVARAYFSAGEGLKAEPWLKLALHEKPSNFLAYYMLGLIAERSGRKDEALAQLKKSIQVKSDYEPAEEALGILLVEMQRYAEALGPLERARSLGPVGAHLENFLGTAYSNTNQLARGAASYAEAVRLDPQYGAARLNLAFAYLKMGKRSQGIAEFQELCRQNPSLCQQYRSYFQ